MVLKHEEHLKTFKELLDDAFFEEAVDILFFWLGIFTYIYFLSTAVLYFITTPYVETIASKILSALAEPYLGTVGIYTILKESRKRGRGVSARHWGELFVAGWLVLFFTASASALLLDIYTLNGILEDIITISLAVTVIYVGGTIHKP